MPISFLLVIFFVNFCFCNMVDQAGSPSAFELLLCISVVYHIEIVESCFVISVNALRCTCWLDLSQF